MNKPFILPETARLLDLMNTGDGPAIEQLEVPALRQAFAQVMEAFEAPAEASVRTLDFIGAGMQLRAYFPGEAKAGPVIVFFHGGGWVIGGLDTHNALCTTIAATSGLRVVAVEYRLAPESRFPAAHDDCLAATRFVASSPVELGAPVTGVAVAGDSAGGVLAFHVSSTLGEAEVLAQFLIYPGGDCTGALCESAREFGPGGYFVTNAMIDRFFGEYMPGIEDRTNRLSSPLNHPLAESLPRAVIMTASLDPIRDQGRDLARKIVLAGREVHFVEAAGMIHGFANMRGALPTGDRIVRRAVAALVDMMEAAAA